MRHAIFQKLAFTLAILAALTLLGWAVSSAVAAGTPAQAVGPWQEVDPARLRLPGGPAPQIKVDQGRYLRLDVPAMRGLLAQAPMEQRGPAAPAGFELSLPMPDGTFQRFAVVESPIMAPELAAKFPEIKTYAGQGLDDPTASIRLDLTPQGFHAMLLSANGTVFIDPLYRQRDDFYVTYAPDALQVDPARQFPEQPPLASPGWLAESAALQKLAPAASHGTQLRTYRLAVAATGEYTAYHGGTVLTGQAAIVTAVNRINEIYETEVAVRMVLVATNDQVVFTNAATDPFTNDDGFTLLDENQTTLDAIIGSANYDVGHVFSTGGGGVAQLGAPCDPDLKAQGVTGSPNPIGDAFWVDYVAHEMGHQFGANHTFNGTAGSCGGNRAAGHAYEPGSGSTIMAYAGICGPHDLQPHSDPYFHATSFDEIVAYTTAGTGNSCAVITATGNQPPSVLSGSDGYTIPKNTPFIMAGTASDPDGHALSYYWEQFDLGKGSGGAPPPVTGFVVPPHFRDFSPTSNPWRIFPRIEDIINNTTTTGEILPSVATTMHFRLTARDNRAGGGGVGNAAYTVTVSGAIGPFRVSAPNTAVIWDAALPQSVTWNVAGTTSAPVSCSKVDIKLSKDGGYTYPLLLAGGTPNDGSEEVNLSGLKNISTSTARIQVACSDNIFFDISNANFQIISHDLTLGQSAAPNPVLINQPLTYTLTITNSGDAAAGVVVTDTLPAQATYVSDTGGCTPVSSGVLQCPLGSLPAAGSRSFDIVVTAPASQVTLVNQAVVGFSGTDLTPQDNQSSLSVEVLDPNQVDLALSGSAPGQVYAGEPLAYTLTAANLSQLPLPGVVVTATLPVDVVYQGDEASCTPLAGQPTVVRCTLGELAVGAVSTVTLQALAPQDWSTTDALTLTFTAQSGFEGIDIDPANNALSLQTSAQAMSDLSLHIAGPAEPVSFGASIAYTLTVSNAGPSTAAGLVLTNTLPAGVAFASASPGCTFATGQVTCSLASLAPAADQVYSLVFTAPTTPVTVTNQAQIGAVTYDPNPANNLAQALAVTVVPRPLYLPYITR